MSTDKPTSTSLAWMPLFISEAKAHSANLSAAQFGALMRLRLEAWVQTPPCTLPDSDVRLAGISGLGEAWGVNAEVLLEFFKPVGIIDDTGKPRLIDPWLETLWLKQFAKYQAASERGRKGGRPSGSGKAAAKQPEKLGESLGFSPLLTAPLSSELSTSLTHRSEDPKAEVSPSFPPAPKAPLEFRKDWRTALAPVAPSARQAPVVADPYTAADDRVNSDSAKLAAIDAALAEHYRSEIAESVDRLRQRHNASYLAHQDEAVKQLGYLNKSDLTDNQKARVEELTLTRISAALGWPSETEYVSRRRATMARDAGLDPSAIVAVAR